MVSILAPLVYLILVGGGGGSSAAQDAGKVVVSRESIQRYWRHWERHFPPHPASVQGRHNPIGISGDDAKWSLAGDKITLVLCNVILQERH